MSDAPTARIENGIYIFRASATDRCARALVAQLMGEQPAPGDGVAYNRIAKAWDEGHQYEPVIINHVEGLGYSVSDQQKTVTLEVADNIRIIGHIDGIAEHDHDVDTDSGPRAICPQYVLECKALSPDSFKRWVSQGFRSYPGYAVQISLYMRGLDLPAFYAVMRKPQPELPSIFTQEHILHPPADLKPVYARLKQIVAWAEAGELPSCDRSDFPCSFNYLHEGDDALAIPALD